MTAKDTPSHLLYVCDTQPGIRRQKRGRGFSYFTADGERITSKEVRSRIQELVIPPAWENVWICLKPNGHIQATGYDEAGRKQYIYHPDWTSYSNTRKYERLTEFGGDLEVIRKRYKKDLRKRKWTWEKVCALATALLDELHLRVGNSHYTRTNNSYGLTTLRRKHLKMKGTSVELHYKGKKGIERNNTVEDNKIRKLLLECSELPGYELFRYKEDGTFHTISSQDINTYLSFDELKNQYTAKDFRTWGANYLTLYLREEAMKICEENPRKKPETTLIRLVAKELGNTVATCRDYYIEPGVLKAALSQKEIPTKYREKSETYEPEELWLIDLLEG
jgi:DNA topoisomerase-1